MHAICSKIQSLYTSRTIYYMHTLTWQLNTTRLFSTQDQHSTTTAILITSLRKIQAFDLPINDTVGFKFI